MLTCTVCLVTVHQNCTDGYGTLFGKDSYYVELNSIPTTSYSELTSLGLQFFIILIIHRPNLSCPARIFILWQMTARGGVQHVRNQKQHNAVSARLNLPSSSADLHIQTVSPGCILLAFMLTVGKMTFMVLHPKRKKRTRRARSGNPMILTILMMKMTQTNAPYVQMTINGLIYRG